MAAPGQSVAVGAARGLAAKHLAKCARAAQERGGAGLGGLRPEERGGTWTGERRRVDGRTDLATEDATSRTGGTAACG